MRRTLSDLWAEKEAQNHVTGAPGLHALSNYFGINFRFDYTYTYTFHCFGNSLQECNRSPLGLPEITLIQYIILLICFQIYFKNIYMFLNYKCNPGAPKDNVLEPRFFNPFHQPYLQQLPVRSVFRAVPKGPRRPGKKHHG